MDSKMFFKFMPNEINNIIVSYLSYKDLTKDIPINISDYADLFYIKFPYLSKLLKIRSDINTYDKNFERYRNWLRLSEFYPYIASYMIDKTVKVTLYVFYSSFISVLAINDQSCINILFFDILKDIYRPINEKLTLYGIKLNKDQLDIFNLMLFLLSHFSNHLWYYQNYISNYQDFDINDSDFEIDDLYDLQSIKELLIDNLKYTSKNMNINDLFPRLYGILLSLMYNDWKTSRRSIDPDIEEYYKDNMRI